MAVDSAQKRFSMINFCSSGIGMHLLFQPDGAVDVDDRQSLLDLFSSGSAGAPAGLGQQWRRSRQRFHLLRR